MNRWFCLVFLACSVLIACKGKRDIPDVSGIKADVKVSRFEKDFFSIDTNNVEASLSKLQQQYGTFLNDYLYNILSLPAVPDSVVKNVKLFLHDYRPVYDSAEQKFSSFAPEEKEIQKALQFVGYYFPKYGLPKEVITFVGPFEGYSNVLTGSGIAVGLQLYMGNKFSAYQTDYIREVYPCTKAGVLSRVILRLTASPILLTILYPPKGRGNATLIEQMVEEGKRMYVLDMLMPETADTLKTGYTKSQLQGVTDNEAAVWNYFIENNLLYTTDPSQIRDYTNDAPRTEALGPESPGNIGLFIGWQIVKKWMSNTGNTVSLSQLLQTDAKQIFQEAKYKPR